MRTESFATPGSVRLRVNIPSGDVDLVTAETDETTVELDVRGRRADEIEREVPIEVRQRGDGHEVIVDADEVRGGVFRNLEFRLRVTAPHGADVDANLASADLRGRGRYGDVKVNAASGDVAVGIASGSRLWVDAQSLSGDTSSELELEGAPSDDPGPLVELRVQTMSGDISVRRA